MSESYNTKKLPDEKKGDDMPMGGFKTLEAPQLDLKKRLAQDSKPIYIFKAPNEESNPPALQVNGTMELTWEISANTSFNLYRSFPEGKLLVSAQDDTTDGYLWKNLCWSDVAKVEFYSKDTPSFKPVDIDSVGRWMRICQAYLISEEEYKGRTKHDVLRLNEDLQQNPFPVSVNNSDFLAPGDKDEPVWLERSELATAHTGRFIWRLGDVKGTLLALDKFMSFPETMVLKFKIDVTRLAWKGTSPTSPQTGAVAVDSDTTYTYSNVRLKLCMEGGPLKDKIEKRLKDGYELVYPIVHQKSHTPSASTSNEFHWQLQKAHGMFCRKIIWAPFHPTVSEVRNYFNLNLLTDHESESDLISEIEDYNTFLDNKQLQNGGVLYNRIKNDSQPYLENTSYEENKSLIDGSAFVKSKKHHQSLFVHCDDWTAGRKELALQGVPLEKTYDVDFKANAMKNTTAVNRGVTQTQNRIYMLYALCTRIMKVRADPGDSTKMLVA